MRLKEGLLKAENCTLEGQIYHDTSYSGDSNMIVDFTKCSFLIDSGAHIFSSGTTAGMNNLYLTLSDCSFDTWDEVPHGVISDGGIAEISLNNCTAGRDFYLLLNGRETCKISHCNFYSEDLDTPLITWLNYPGGDNVSKLIIENSTLTSETPALFLKANMKRLLINNNNILGRIDTNGKVSGIYSSIVNNNTISNTIPSGLLYNGGNFCGGSYYFNGGNIYINGAPVK